MTAATSHFPLSCCINNRNGLRGRFVIGHADLILHDARIEGRALGQWLRNILIVALVAGANALVWTGLNRPVDGPSWTGKVQGAAWSPYAIDGDPLYRHPTPEQLRADLQILARHFTSLRTYSVLDGLDRIPELAKDLPLTFTLGAWVDQRKERSRQEIERLVATANAYPSVARVLVGNEAVLRKDLTPAEIIPYIREVRRRVKQPEIGRAHV